MSNTRLNNTRCKEFRHLNTLDPYSNVKNPYDHETLVAEITTRKHQNNIFVQPPPTDTQVLEAHEVLKKADQKSQRLVADMQYTLGVESPEHELSGIRIVYRREAQLTHGRMEFRPTTFELDREVEVRRVYNKEEYTTEPGLDFLDNRVPLRVLEAQKLQKKLFEKPNQWQSQHTNVVEYNSPTKEHVDHLDVALKYPCITTVTKQLLGQASILSPTVPQFATGKCLCQCHTDGDFKQKICLYCFCKHEQSSTQAHKNFSTRGNSLNLLQDVPIPMYRYRKYSIMEYEGELTNQVIGQMIDEYLSTLSPNKRLQTVSDQVCNLTNRMWSVALRSDVSPHMDVESVHNMLNKPSNLNISIDQPLSLEEYQRLRQQSHSDVVQIQRIRDRKPKPLTSKVISRECDNYFFKSTRNVTIEQILETRRRQANTVEQAQDSVRPSGSSLRVALTPCPCETAGAQFPESPRHKHHGHSPKQRDYMDGTESYMEALRTFYSPFKKPKGCLYKLDGIDFQSARAESYKAARGGDRKTPGSNRTSNARSRAISPIYNMEQIRRQNEQLRKTLGNVQSRVTSPAFRQVCYDSEAQKRRDTEWQHTQDQLVKYVYETQMTDKDMKQMIRRTQKRLVEIDRRATANAGTRSPINFRILHERRNVGFY